MKNSEKILLIDDDAGGRMALTRLLTSAGYDVDAASSGKEAIYLLENSLFSLVITDLFLPDTNGIELLKHVKLISPDTEVIVITGNASAETAVRAMKDGAYDYITKPLNFEELKIIVSKALEKLKLRSENIYLKKQLRDKYEFSNIIGNSPAMQNVFNLMRRIIKTDSTVLVLGESGTGKEIVAKAIHFNSHRKDKPFIAVHCGAIPETLLESELFGHTKGAFTGAHKEKFGKFQAADGGTVFLDEIGTMPMQLQIKLLRVLQEQEVEMIGSNRSSKINIRVISATNQNLADDVKKGLFREDLYYRLNVIPLVIPPLRDRKSDILQLLKHFMAKYTTSMGREMLSITREAFILLEKYDWPGNVRELENVVERMTALTEGDQIKVEDLPPYISLLQSDMKHGLMEMPETGIDLQKTVYEFEIKMITEAMNRSAGVKARAAAMLGLNRTTLVEKMRRMRITL